MKCEFSPQARSDLIDILRFIASEKPQAAVRFVENLEKQCEILTLFPMLGTDQSHLSEGLRVLTYRSYCIYFRVAAVNESIRIERVLAPGLNVRTELFHEP